MTIESLNTQKNVLLLYRDVTFPPEKRTPAGMRSIVDFDKETAQ